MTSRAAIGILRLLLAVCLPLSTSCGGRDPVPIGFLGGLSGKMSDIGSYVRDGAILAVEDRNATGGIGGRRVRLEIRDDGQDPEQAARMVADLADRGTLAIVGPILSSMAVRVAPVADERQIVMVSPTATTDELSGRDDYFLRVVPTVREISARMADRLVDREGVRSVAAVCDLRNRSYTENWVNRFRDRLASRGGRIVHTERFVSAEGVRFLPMASRLASSGADAILIAANASDAAMLCHQLRKSGWRKTIAVVEWASSEKFLEMGGSSVEGVLVSQFFDRESREPRYLDFVERYRKRFGADPGFPSVLGYDAATVVLDGLEADGVRGGAELRERILRAGSYRGLQETFGIDRAGDALRDTHLAVVRDGRYRVIR